MARPPVIQVEPPAVTAGRARPPLRRYRHPGDVIRLAAGVGMPAGPAVSAVLLHRQATYWLPVAPGRLSWRVLQRREYP